MGLTGTRCCCTSLSQAGNGTGANRSRLSLAAGRFLNLISPGVVFKNLSSLGTAASQTRSRAGPRPPCTWAVLPGTRWMHTHTHTREGCTQGVGLACPLTGYGQTGHRTCCCARVHTSRRDVCVQKDGSTQSHMQTAAKTHPSTRTTRVQAGRSV